MRAMDAALLAAYADPARHEAISRILRRRSTNRTDVRDAALTDLDLSACHAVLDLGCGFGFMSTAVAERAAPDAAIIGVDICAANQAPFLERIAACGRRGHFVCRALDAQLDWPDRSFDLVVAAYALYFFPRLVPEIARVLTPDGLFVALTHVAACARRVLERLGIFEHHLPLQELTERFCAENASSVLAPCFEQIERVDYLNTLVFETTDHADLQAYVEFKRPFLSTARSPCATQVAALRDAAVVRDVPLELPNDVAIFRCRAPHARHDRAHP